uniref:SURP motif domain-containing protein n=1 Tax=Emiliania huxleyi TaxID=2903 RepID=A0A7S3SYE9_EMIHU
MPIDQAVIEKLAKYVAQANDQMEAAVRERQRGNPQFAFLFGGEGAKYYRECLQRFRMEAAGSGAGDKPPPEKSSLGGCGWGPPSGHASNGASGRAAPGGAHPSDGHARDVRRDASSAHMGGYCGGGRGGDSGGGGWGHQGYGAAPVSGGPGCASSTGAARQGGGAGGMHHPSVPPSGRAPPAPAHGCGAPPPYRDSSCGSGRGAGPGVCGGAGGGGGGGGGGPGGGHSGGHGGGDDPNLPRILELLERRDELRSRREWAEADRLKEELFALNVRMDDRNKTWCIKPPGGGDGSSAPSAGAHPCGGAPPAAPPRRPTHDYVRASDDRARLSASDEAAIHELLARRLSAKIAREFDTADAVRDELRKVGVEVIDRDKLWRVVRPQALPSAAAPHPPPRPAAIPAAPPGGDRGGGVLPALVPGVPYEQQHDYRCSSDPAELRQVDLGGVHELLARRLAAKKGRQYELADEMRLALRERYAVEVFDRDKLWRVVPPSAGGGAAGASEWQRAAPLAPSGGGGGGGVYVPRGPPRVDAVAPPVAGPFGGAPARPPVRHGYSREPGDTAWVDMSRLDALLSERMASKFARDFARADELREVIKRELGVEVAHTPPRAPAAPPLACAVAVAPSRRPITAIGQSPTRAPHLRRGPVHALPETVARALAPGRCTTAKRRGAWRGRPPALRRTEAREAALAGAARPSSRRVRLRREAPSPSSPRASTATLQISKTRAAVTAGRTARARAPGRARARETAAGGD